MSPRVGCAAKALPLALQPLKSPLSKSQVMPCAGVACEGRVGGGRVPEVPGAPTSRLQALRARLEPNSPLAVLRGVSRGGVRMLCRPHHPSLKTASG